MANNAKLKRDTDHILQEIRIVLPGTQALMGFQFITFFNPAFQSLPSHLKNLHFEMLLLLIFCTFFLIAPVAFQQIGDNGNLSSKFLSFTRKMLITAMLCLLLAITGDVYISAKTIDIQETHAKIIAAITLSSGLFLWYIYALLRKNSK